MGNGRRAPRSWGFIGEIDGVVGHNSGCVVGVECRRWRRCGRIGDEVEDRDLTLLFKEHRRWVERHTVRRSAVIRRLYSLISSGACT